MPTVRGVPMWHRTVYTSATLVASGNSGILAFKDQVTFMWDTHLHYCSHFVAVGTNLLTDETMDLTLDFYTEAAGVGGSVGTITFNQLIPATLFDLEAWPGDITAFTIDTPVPPYFKLTWTLGGAVKSMEVVLYGNFWRIE